MYVTRRLSDYKNSPELISEPPPEGPSSGYLVVRDKESIDSAAGCCWGSCESLDIEDLPLSSNKVLDINYGSDDDEAIFIPVVDQPLSSNRYYAIKVSGNHKGEAYVCSKEEDKGIGCCGSYIKDVKPRPLDADDIYQQFEFFTTTTTTCTNSTTKQFTVKSAAQYGHPPYFLRRHPLNIRTSVRRTKDLIESDALGLDSALRTHLPPFEFPLSREFSVPVNMGKWYCPFMFVKDGKLKDQVKKSVFHEIRLEQRWDRVFFCERNSDQPNTVTMDVIVATEEVRVNGRDCVSYEGIGNDKMVWFTKIGDARDEETIGVSKMVIERMKWEEERGGWVNEKEKQVRLFRVEEYGGIGWWARFGCYVMVERFILRSKDGSFVLTYDFKHIGKISCKWE